VVGLDSGRLSDHPCRARGALRHPFTGLDVFLNVAGGLRVTEPAADLAVAAALLSAREDVAIPPDMVLFGEISLSGALRPVGQTENRLKEAAKLGFSQATVPSRPKLGGDGSAVRQMPDLTAFVGEMFGAG
jgi:DNA repair protein RadA/Sms